MTKIIGNTTETLEERLELICKEAIKKGFGTCDDIVNIELDSTETVCVTFFCDGDTDFNMLDITFHLNDMKIVVNEKVDDNKHEYEYTNDCWDGWNRIYILTVIEHVSYEFLKVWS